MQKKLIQKLDNLKCQPYQFIDESILLVMKWDLKQNLKNDKENRIQFKEDFSLKLKSKLLSTQKSDSYIKTQRKQLSPQQQTKFSEQISYQQEKHSNQLFSSNSIKQFKNILNISEIQKFQIIENNQTKILNQISQFSVWFQNIQQNLEQIRSNNLGFAQVEKDQKHQQELEKMRLNYNECINKLLEQAELFDKSKIDQQFEFQKQEDEKQNLQKIIDDFF